MASTPVRKTAVRTTTTTINLQRNGLRLQSGGEESKVKKEVKMAEGGDSLKQILAAFKTLNDNVNRRFQAMEQHLSSEMLQTRKDMCELKGESIEIKKEIEELKNTMKTEISKVEKDLRTESKASEKRSMERCKKMEGAMLKQNEVLRNVTASLKSTTEELKETKEQVVKLENRDRRFNLRLRNFPDSVSTNMKDKLITWMSDNGVQITADELERCHWTYKVQGKNSDILVKFVRQATCDRVYKALRKIKDLKFDSVRVWPLPDLAAATLRQRAEMKKIVDFLNLKGQRYQWLAPATLLVLKDNVAHRATNVSQGVAMLKNLGFDPAEVDEAMKENGRRDVPGEGSSSQEERPGPARDGSASPQDRTPAGGEASGSDSAGTSRGETPEVPLDSGLDDLLKMASEITSAIPRPPEVPKKKQRKMKTHITRSKAK